MFWVGLVLGTTIGTVLFHIWQVNEDCDNEDCEDDID